MSYFFTRPGETFIIRVGIETYNLQQLVNDLMDDHLAQKGDYSTAAAKIAEAQKLLEEAKKELHFRVHGLTVNEGEVSNG